MFVYRMVCSYTGWSVSIQDGMLLYRMGCWCVNIRDGVLIYRIGCSYTGCGLSVKQQLNDVKTAAK